MVQGTAMKDNDPAVARGKPSTSSLLDLFSGQRPQRKGKVRCKLRQSESPLSPVDTPSDFPRLITPVPLEDGSRNFPE
jgi:hypothetical protein